MATNRTATLVMLSDTDQVIADPAEDIRGRRVKDADGEDLGKVDDLLLDTEQNKVRFLRVEHGGVMGFGATPSFIPVDAIAAITHDEIRISHARDKVAGAPRYDPDIVDESTYYGDLYGHYGYPPFWATGYPYPGYHPMVSPRHPG